MHDCKLMDTLVEKNLSLSLDMCLRCLMRKNKCPKYLTPALSMV